MTKGSLQLTNTFELQKELRKQLSDDKSFTEQKKTEEGETELGEVTKLAEQHAIWGRAKKNRGKGKSMLARWLELDWHEFLSMICK